MIDRLDSLLIVGMFLFIYIQLIVYHQEDTFKSMQEMILTLSRENQEKLY